MLKKRILFTLALIMVLLSFGACADKGIKDKDSTVGIVDENINDGNLEEDYTDTANKEDNKIENEENIDENKEANIESSNGQDENSSKESALTQSLTDVANQIYEIKSPGIKTFDNPLDLTNADAVKYNTGLSDSSKVKEVLVSEAMMTSQAYSMVLVRVNDAKDSESVAKEMLDGINPAKWICVTGDDLQIVTMDDVILLIMVSSQLSDSVTSQEIVDAFAQVGGNKFGAVLSK